MPVWADIVIAFGSGSLGAVWTARYQAKSNREERFRDRMIEAADDFGTAASAAFTSLRQACETWRYGNPEALEPARQEAWAKRDHVLQQSARIDLLYEPRSPTGLAGSRVLNELARGCQLLNQDQSLVDRFLTSGPEELKSFQLAALGQVENRRIRTLTMRPGRTFRGAHHRLRARRSLS